MQLHIWLIAKVYGVSFKYSRFVQGIISWDHTLFGLKIRIPNSQEEYLTC